MPIYKIICPQLNNCALHISCYTTNVEHRFIQLLLLWFCLGARIVFSPSGSFQLRCSLVLFLFAFVGIPDWIWKKRWRIFRGEDYKYVSRGGVMLVSSGFYVK